MNILVPDSAVFDAMLAAIWDASYSPTKMKILVSHLTFSGKPLNGAIVFSGVFSWSNYFFKTFPSRRQYLYSLLDLSLANCVFLACVVLLFLLNLDCLAFLCACFSST